MEFLPFTTALAALLGNLVSVAQFNDGSQSSKEIIAKLNELLELTRKKEQTQIDSLIPRNKWHEWDELMKPHTIIIVTGCDAIPETFDRPIAYSIKEYIDRKGNELGIPLLQSVVIGDRWYLDNKTIWSKFESNTLISIGGTAVNHVTGKIAASNIISKHIDGGGQILSSDREAAILGGNPRETYMAFQYFILNMIDGIITNAWASLLKPTTPSIITQHRR